MKLFLLSNCLSSVCLTYLFCSTASSQYFEDPTLFFKPFEFDSMLRGQYNVTQCALDLINCWEIIRPDVICDSSSRWDYDFETYCGIQKKYCSDTLGDFDGFKNRFMAFTGYCQGRYYEWFNLGHWT